MRWQEPFGPGRPGDERRRQEQGREGRIEEVIRQSERRRICAWLRTDAPNAGDNDIGALADAIERGERWK